MAPARIKPGNIGRIEWDYERHPGKVRGVARTRDAADKPRRVVAVRDTCEEVEAELRTKAASLLYLGDIWSPATTLEEAIERWIATLGDADEGNAQRPQSVETYARTARGVIVPRIGALRLGDIPTPQLRDFMKEMREAPHRTRRVKGAIGYSVSYRLHILRALRDSLGLAASMGAIPLNPARDLPRPSKNKAAETGPHSCAGGRVARLYASLGGQQKIGAAERPAVAPSDRARLATGCRIGEVGGFLMDETTDVPSLRLAVTGTIVTVAGKTFRANELKDDEQARILELPSWARAVVDECRSIATRSGPDAPLLQGLRGAKQSPAYIRARLASLKLEYREPLEVAGIDLDDFTFHTLRRTVLTVVDEAVGRIYSQAQAGHADARTTAGYISTPRALPIIVGAAGAIDTAFGHAS
ncbi:hypothetical protein ITJ43_12155 [Microbacterium sp. VKM Ac-2870]|uniref:tyrosine-type recombinase/integrase n=1 Tax=Microbacterium sp. VKM Ac-2870 TaxID=2783825 RepID=UPI00188CE46A|nr:hypothetical protein [Microbacterium sp. VKM Ac-2870]MBF4562888.1 hypothetical protein [Microbacterium sp. VKM Ac-2870]